MNAPLNGVAEIPLANNSNLWSWISPVSEFVRPWNLLIRISYRQNYKTAMSDKISCWEGEQFPLILKRLLCARSLVKIRRHPGCRNAMLRTQYSKSWSEQLSLLFFLALICIVCCIIVFLLNYDILKLCMWISLLLDKHVGLYSVCFGCLVCWSV